MITAIYNWYNNDEYALAKSQLVFFENKLKRNCAPSSSMNFEVVNSEMFTLNFIEYAFKKSIASAPETPRSFGQVLPELGGQFHRILHPTLRPTKKYL